MSAECYIIVTVFIKKESDGRWTAECRELGTATFGNSFEEAEESIREAMELHLNTLEQVGEAENFFRENSIKRLKRVPRRKSISIDVPFGDQVFAQSVQLPIQACASQ